MADLLRDLVVIEDGLLYSMAHNQAFVKEFPFLSGLQQLQQAKGCCSSAPAKKDTAYTAAKRTIAGLDSAKKVKLKALLKAKQARIIYTHSNGKQMNLTF